MSFNFWISKTMSFDVSESFFDCLFNVPNSSKLRKGAKVLLHKVAKPELFGVAKINKNKKMAPGQFFKCFFDQKLYKHL